MPSRPVSLEKSARKRNAPFFSSERKKRKRRERAREVRTKGKARCGLRCLAAVLSFCGFEGTGSQAKHTDSHQYNTPLPAAHEGDRSSFQVIRPVAIGCCTTIGEQKEKARKFGVSTQTVSPIKAAVAGRSRPRCNSHCCVALRRVRRRRCA